MKLEQIIKQKLGFKYFFTFNSYTDKWACIHSDHLKYYYGCSNDNPKNLKITYGNTLEDCVMTMCKVQGIDTSGGNNELWFEYGTD